MPDRDYYLGTDERKHGELQAKYRTHIATILKLANVADADAKAARIYDLEKKIAGRHATREESADVAQGQQPVEDGGFRRKGSRASTGALISRRPGSQAQPMIMVWHPGAVNRHFGSRRHRSRSTSGRNI